ncbi:MAG: phosphate ABC transporter permease PstA [Gammaproteobacteria bacterium]
MENRAALLRRRYARQRRFAVMSGICIAAAAIFLGALASSVAVRGWRGFLQSSARLDIFLDAKVIGAQGEKSALAYRRLIRKTLLNEFPEAKNRNDKKYARNIAGAEAGVVLRAVVRDNPDNIGKLIPVWLPAGALAESYFKNAADADALRLRGVPETHIARLKMLKENGRTRTAFNWGFFRNADSRNAESAGIGGALLGSLYTLLLAFAVSFPLGAAAAVYLELFAPRGPRWRRFLDIVEININNLAAVPSVIFGLLGLAVFINVFNMPRSSSLVGGLVLALMTLPTIIIAARAALKSAPPSLLAAALSLGASRMQGVFHHVLPAAMPGILTGAILGMAQALGETAPLLMIGMVAFIADAPSGITDAATALPVQIFLWADSPERGFAERTATAILVLLGFLIAMNAAAAVLRRKMEMKW